MSEIVSLMLGTAGHVDHGKTSLVRQLTGFNTDRHPEERERGMSIDFAVAPLQLPDGRTAGIIDVPGHEDFIRNMVSGASAINLLLLVVAADDGIMPQTEEHLRIAKAFGMSALIIVLTKVDLVPPELVDVVEADVQKFVEGFDFHDAPIVRVSNTTSEGITELRAEITSAFSNVNPPNDNRAFRMPVRQVFSAKGHGTVITGVPESGALRVDDQVEILPLGKNASVRGIQNYKYSTTETLSRRSTAVNLRFDFDPQEVTRGMVLAAPGLYRATTQIIAWFRNDSRSATLPPRGELLFHSGTLSALGKVRLIDCSEVPPGSEAFVRIRFAEPVALAAGDRFVLRQSTSHVTYGGGRILSVFVSQSRKLSEALFERLILAREAVEKSDYFLTELLAGSRFCFTSEDLRVRSQLPDSSRGTEISRMVHEGSLVNLGQGSWLVSARKKDLRLAIRRAAERYHVLQKFAWGMKPTLVCELLQLPATCFDKLSEILFADETLQLKHGRVALSGFAPQIGAREIRIREDVFRLIEDSGILSIARRSLLERLKLSEPELKSALRSLVEEELIVQLESNFVLRSHYDDARRRLLEIFAVKPVVELADFREKTGASRNVATYMLDAFDAEGLTRRTEAGRVLLKPPPPLRKTTSA